MNINLNEKSTERGIVWAITGLGAIVAYLIGKDPSPILAIGAAVAGGLGVARSDNQP